MGVMTWLSDKPRACVPLPAPQRIPQPRPLAQTRPFRSPAPRKNRHFPAPPVLWPCHPNVLQAPSHWPTSAQFLPTVAAQSRSLATPSCNMRTYVLPSPRRGTDPAARNPYPPIGIMPQASVGASLAGALCQRIHGRSARRPPVLLCHAARHFCAELPTPAFQNCAEPSAPPARSRTECRRI